ncbi:transposase [Streptomyces sp. AGS-58]|uniref:IS701 family transposase n=1 Tax=unclassified Streptomyces TaxID=2593676 RepID=UPI0035A3856C
MWSAQPCACAAHEPSVPAPLVAEASGRVFASLVRSGYRLKAEQYVRALLAVPGRKTLKTIGAQCGGAAAGQSMHHFITASPWDWRPVRRALARYAQQALAPEALVVTPAVVLGTPARPAKADRSAVRRRVPAEAAPQALGAWLVSVAGSVPVDWHLMPLPRLGGAAGSHPGTGTHSASTTSAPVAAGGLHAHVLETAADAARLLRPWRGPVVVDADGPDAVDTVHGLLTRGDDFIVRVAAGTPLRIDRSRLPRCDARQSTAAGLAAALTELRRPLDPCGTGVTAAAIPVTLEPRSTRDDPPALLLLGQWERGRRPRSLWVTNIRSLPLPALLRLARLPDRVRHDMADVSARLGLRDYSGRSYRGCHHHLTLVSVAQLLAVLHAAADGPAHPCAA